MKQQVYMALYAPSSVQKLLDFLRTIYAVEFVIPVIIRPFGAAAQVGIPEAHRIAYKLNKPLLVLPELADLRHIVKCDSAFYLVEDGEEIGLHRLIEEIAYKRVALIMSSGEQEPSGKELEGLATIWLKDVPRGMPCTALAGIIVYELHRYFKQG